jgi:hypothetical protein
MSIVQMPNRAVFSIVAGLLAGNCQVNASDEGLVLHYPFDELTGDMVHDASGNENLGRISGASYVPTATGNALRFDGQSSFVDCGTQESLHLTKAVTLEAWVRPDRVAPYLLQMVVGKGKACSLFARSGGWVQFPSWRDAAEAPFMSGMWHHLVGTFDESNSRIYIDGKQLAANIHDPKELKVDRDTPFLIGAGHKDDDVSEVNWRTAFAGLIDNVRIYNRPLTAEEVAGRYDSTRAEYGLNLRSFAYRFNDEIVVEFDNVAAGSTIEVEIPSTAGSYRASSKADRDGYQSLRLKVPGLAAGIHLIQSDVTSKDGQASEKAQTRILWPKRPAWPEAKPEYTVLNNFVTELLLLDKPSPGEFRFTNPRNGWLFISSSARAGGEDGVDVYLEAVSRERPILVHGVDAEPTLESMRKLPAGEYALRIDHQGKPRHDSLVVRTMPETLHIRMCRQPDEPPGAALQQRWGAHVIPNFPLMDWDWLWPDVLRNCNVLSAHYGARSRIVEKDRAGAWQKSGRKILYELVVPGVGSGTVTADSAYSYWTERDPYTDPRCDIIGVDEFGSYDAQKFGSWIEAQKRIRAHETYGKKQFLGFYNHGCYYGEDAVSFAERLVRQGDTVGLETYLYEVPAPYVRSYFDANIRGNLARWAELAPGIQKGTMEVLGYFSMPTIGNWAAHSRVDFKVFMDMQFKIMATDPVFWELYGVSNYASRKADEEFVRWQGRLFRHYCIEGKTDLLSKEYGYLYELDHIRNVDFADGLEQWSPEPAEPGAIEAPYIDGLQVVLGSSAALNADRALVMTRSEKGPNTVSQRLHKLSPGKPYVLAVYTGDYEDMITGTSVKKPDAVSITITDAEVDEARSFVFNGCMQRNFKPFGIVGMENPFWHNYHRIVFRPRSTDSKLIMSDWASSDAPGGPAGQRLLFGLIELHPYYEM